MVVMEFSQLSALRFSDFPDARGPFQSFLLTCEWTSVAIVALPPAPPHPRLPHLECQHFESLLVTNRFLHFPFLVSGPGPYAFLGTGLGFLHSSSC